MRTCHTRLHPDPVSFPEINIRLRNYLRISGHYVLRTAAGWLAISAMSYLLDNKEYGTAAAFVLWLFFFIQAQINVGKILFHHAGRTTQYVYSAAVTFFTLAFILLEVVYHEHIARESCTANPGSSFHYCWSALWAMIVVWELAYLILNHTLLKHAQRDAVLGQ